MIIADPAELNGRLQAVMETCRDSGVALKVISPGLQPYADAVTYIPGLDCPLFVVHPQPAGAASYLVKQVGGPRRLGRTAGPPQPAVPGHRRRHQG